MEKPKRNTETQQSKGVRTTNRHPAKILYDSGELKILASNIDTLVLSLDILWEDPVLFFIDLAEAKIKAQVEKIDFPLSYPIGESDFEYLFNVHPRGANGYEWILLNQEYSLIIGKWSEPQSMPSVIITIRSETLWRKGPRTAVEFILNFLKNVGGRIQKIRVSRLDLCVDTLFPFSLWSESILDYAVTRATYDDVIRNHKQLATIDIGKSKIKARIYDKPLEIQQKSNKVWFFDIWGIKEVLDTQKIIRTEFQLRREVLKELGVDSLEDLFTKIQNIWSYCTTDWLKFQDNPGKQSSQRETLSWWITIQNGFSETLAGSPAIRQKAVRKDKDKLSYQILGLLSSFAAIDCMPKESSDITLNRAIYKFQKHVSQNNLCSINFTDRVGEKIAKFQRTNEKVLDFLHDQKELGFLPVTNKHSTKDVL